MFNYFLGPRASIELPSEAFLAVYNGVYVPWNGGTGRLMVNRPLLGNETTITVNNQAVANQTAISGVNLDEEAAKLLQWQQAYGAAAKALQIGSSLFQSLLAAVQGA